MLSYSLPYGLVLYCMNNETSNPATWGKYWLQFIKTKAAEQGEPRPCNHTKIYGGGYFSFGTGGLEDGVERFWRNIIGGSASSRFHRPTWDNGLNDRAKGSIKAARLLESVIKLWDIEPHMELLREKSPNEAYLAAKPGEQYALYSRTAAPSASISRMPKVYWISGTEDEWWGKDVTI